jgi:FkbM family methyltransferase
LIRRGIVEWRRARVAAALLPLKRAMLGPETMVGVDVGSAGGLQPHWRAFEGLVEFYCFEPHDESFKKLTALFAAHPSSQKFHVMRTGLSGTGGERTLYMLNTSTGSSLCPINTGSEYVSAGDRYIYPIREAGIQTRRLADVLDDAAVRNVDIIKLDVQGAELEILKGLGDVRRKNLLLAEVEVNICGGISRNFSPYEGAPTWLQIEEMLIADGMRLLDISAARAYRARDGDSDWYQREVFDVYRNSPSLSAHIWEVDVVYVRDWRTLVAGRDAAAIRKLAIALCGYRFFSEAYFILERSAEAGIFDPATATALKKNIVDWHRAGRSLWHGRQSLWNYFRRGMRSTGMSQLLRWKQYMWFDYPNG